ncbi:hypothetical protein HOD05_00815 [Candidatus Woesearchaeota archaeon]|jgi:hypothetical protein|nr:hypothetical protein [Candidatus Woesearchaeota archaeon]MBT4150948.1 hypothetical protein [Candidatus Woesearchaeota archaeon]MBT4247321.1 hypothetical protein [Candidatus Woesearchaeota archaeon]MBT4433738.1 hypothetical protein [Candidatus Woesearchaeota archaeon]MBT7755060.1 hypothetical protein [Candidatus Magasanikbacteria bacterium]
MKLTERIKKNIVSACVVGSALWVSTDITSAFYYEIIDDEKIKTQGCFEEVKEISYYTDLSGFVEYTDYLLKTNQGEKIEYRSNRRYNVQEGECYEVIGEKVNFFWFYPLRLTNYK